MSNEDPRIAKLLSEVVPPGETWSARSSGVVAHFGRLLWWPVLAVVTDRRVLVVRQKDQQLLFDAMRDQDLEVRPPKSMSASTGRAFVRFLAGDKKISVGFPPVEVAHNRSVFNDATAELLEHLDAQIKR
jgi:hypothetical protein